MIFISKILVIHKHVKINDNKLFELLGSLSGQVLTSLRT